MPNYDKLKIRIRSELRLEIPLLLARWKTIFLGLLFQYVHGVFVQLAHFMHRPALTPLHDIGFEILPEIGDGGKWVSETIFGILFASFGLWSFSPFYMTQRKFYTAVLYARLLTVLVVCQCLRVASFSVTQLPAPHYHCRQGAELATIRPPASVLGLILVNVGRAAANGCGDLIFSSHTTFILVGTLTYSEYGSMRIMKVIVWLSALCLSLLIIASRKHYTVDVLVAWYTVPLVFWTLHGRWTLQRPDDEEDMERLELPVTMPMDNGDLNGDHNPQGRYKPAMAYHGDVYGSMGMRH